MGAPQTADRDDHREARRPSPVVVFLQATSLGDVRSMLLIVGLCVAAPPDFDEPGRIVIAGIAAYLTGMFLLSYNNYMGRREDEFSLKRESRPFAGHASRVRWLEVCLITMAVLACVLPLLVDAPAQAAINAANIVGYIAAFRNRRARRPIAALKMGESVLSVGFVALGLMLAVDAPGWACLALPLAVSLWRLEWEVGGDIAEAGADRRSGVVTPGTEWPPGPLLAMGGALGAAGFLVYGIVTSAGTESGVVSLPIVCGAVAAALVIGAAVAARGRLDHTSASMVRQSGMFGLVLAIGSAAVAAGRTVAGALYLVVLLAWLALHWLPRDIKWLRGEAGIPIE